MYKLLSASAIALATVQADASIDCTVKIFANAKKQSESKLVLKETKPGEYEAEKDGYTFILSMDNLDRQSIRVSIYDKAPNTTRRAVSIFTSPKSELPKTLATALVNKDTPKGGDVEAEGALLRCEIK